MMTISHFGKVPGLSRSLLSRSKGKPMTQAETVALVRQAREGDRGAWDALLERYYERWVGKYHRDLGSTIRKLYDTQDVVQSAVGDALRDLPQLENEAAFFTWVTSIIRHKIATRRRRLGRETPGGKNSGQGISQAADPDDAGPEPSAAELDDYIHALDKILELFPEYPEPMAAVAMAFVDRLSVNEMLERFGKSKTSVYRWLETGIELLKGHLKQVER